MDPNKPKPQRMMNHDGSMKPGAEPDLLMPKSGVAFDAIYFARRGVVHLAGLDDGNEVILRFRAHEIALLEGRRKMGVLSMLNEHSLGISFLADALLVGAAHQFVTARGKSGKRGALNEARVSRWIDRCEENGIPFEDLLQAVVKAVVGGLPGGDKYLEAMEVEDDEDTGRPPSAPAA